MDAKTLFALRGSIRKWEKIVAGKGTDRGADNCPLCLLTDNSCTGCPVNKITKNGCSPTPFAKWDSHQIIEHPTYAINKVRCPECKRLAKAELSFLRGLLSKNKKRK
jgi:hypothetical protein